MCLHRILSGRPTLAPQRQWKVQRLASGTRRSSALQLPQPQGSYSTGNLHSQPSTTMHIAHQAPSVGLPEGAVWSWSTQLLLPLCEVVGMKGEAGQGPGLCQAGPGSRGRMFNRQAVFRMLVLEVWLEYNLVGNARVSTDKEPQGVERR